MSTTERTPITTLDLPPTKRTRTTTPTTATSPFTATGFERKYRRKDTNEREVVDVKSGELFTQQPVVSISVWVDTKPYAKIFLRGIDEILKSDLSSSAFKLLLYIMKNLTPRKEEIVINLADCLKVCKWDSPGAFSSPARELIRKRFIAKSTKGKMIYWINPDYFFNGNRQHLSIGDVSKD